MLIEADEIEDNYMEKKSSLKFNTTPGKRFSNQGKEEEGEGKQTDEKIIDENSHANSQEEE